MLILSISYFYEHNYRNGSQTKGTEMTYATLKKAGIATLSALAFTAALPAVSAMAADAPASEFVVKSTTDGRIKLGVKAFKKGDFEKSASYSRQALNASLSRKKTAIAQSNLCAAYARLDMIEEAQTACSAALELRPDYAPAQSNNAALEIRLAQK